MHLEWLRIKSVRNLLDVQLQLNPDVNVFSGNNGSGKTALLEAIHCLSRCRSFRTPRINHVVNHQQKTLQISAGLQHPEYGCLTTGIERGSGKIAIRFNHQNVAKVSSQAAEIPVIPVTPDSHELVTGSPAHRRKWLDWAMFHVEHGYIEHWRNYHKALKQRNYLLQHGMEEELDVWERQLAKAAIRINTAREKYLQTLLQQLESVAGQLAVDCPQLLYRPGWPDSRSLAACLKESRQQDVKMARTRYGVHRSELAISVNGGLIAHSYSRGQIKLLINALSWSQALVIHKHTGKYPILLADDFLAELDKSAKQRITEVYGGYPGQVFMTTTNDPFVTDLFKEKLFHVKHGEVNPW